MTATVTVKSAGARVYAVSDLHVDYSANLAWVTALSSDAYQRDTLIVAGDVSDNLDRLEQALGALRDRFARVFFTAGNHELWIRRKEFPDSWQKLRAIDHLCDSINVETKPGRVPLGETGHAWVVPLKSWYIKPEEGAGSLFVRKRGEDPTLTMWADNYFVRWPTASADADPVALRLLATNPEHLEVDDDEPVVTFSHFLPRQDLIFSTDYEAVVNPNLRKDDYPSFNFSRVAGCTQLDEQLRGLGATAHVYGHQHRNRRRLVDGVLYISNCMGYPPERDLDADPHDELVSVW
ncbi:MAG: hypothetical protein CMQ61_06525 [Gammaproteobacteria bacterium]|nr:hypothetical protein [Gammaproteobacteria bacterium]|tara:strand:+ start:114 stop:992 length:879 start_codon:yes stop_codon:yes gene_type:complete